MTLLKIGKMKKLNKTEDQYLHEIKQWKEKYLRALADYQNLEKRVQQEKKAEAGFAAKEIILRLLPVIDSFEKLMEVVQDKGLILTFTQLQDVLKSENVEKTQTLGEMFIPYEMECVEIQKDDADGKVVKEISPGYKMKDKIIRIAKVV